MMISYQIRRGFDMPKAVRKTISLPFDLAREVDDIAREERKTLSAVIQDALKVSWKERLRYIEIN